MLCPLSRCTAAPVLGPTPCGRAHLRPTPRVSGACLGPNEGAQPAGLPPGPHLARHGERPGYLVKRAVLACSTADPGPHRHNCSPRFRFSDAPGTPFDGLYSGPDLGRRFEIARISARWDPQTCLAFSKEQVQRSKLRHIDCRQEWVQSLRDASIVDLQWVESESNFADLFTKILEAETFVRLRDQLMLFKPIPGGGSDYNTGDACAGAPGGAVGLN